jgi:hypothetical protein
MHDVERSLCMDTCAKRLTHMRSVRAALGADVVRRGSTVSSVFLGAELVSRVRPLWVSRIEFEIAEPPRPRDVLAAFHGHVTADATRPAPRAPWDVCCVLRIAHIGLSAHLRCQSDPFVKGLFGNFAPSSFFW